ncbi:MAG TPA: hypothetical protein VNW94_15970, partial [Streptosporangiaceae bacterium]|nr:hypothetical protein [Streptosporangiaceae bacterium]
DAALPLEDSDPVLGPDGPDGGNTLVLKSWPGVSTGDPHRPYLLDRITDRADATVPEVEAE